MNPTVSIITTVYNRALYLGQCIESVQGSKYKDYEHIIVDDCSTDESLAIAKQYASQDEKIKIFTNPKNLGDYPNRNKAAQHAQGQFIKYLDADDLHSPWILDVMTDSMQRFPDAGFGLIDYGPDITVEPTLVSGKQIQSDFYSGKRRTFNRSPINAIIRRSAFNTVGGFTGKRMVGDFEMWHLLSQQFDLVIIPSSHAYYRKHDDQEGTVHSSDPIWSFRYLLISREQLESPLNPLPPDNKNYFLRQTKQAMARRIIRGILTNGISKSNEMRREAKWTWTQVLQNTF